MAVTLTTRAAEHVQRYIEKRGKGVGLRLGANVGYLKFTDRATWRT